MFAIVKIAGKQFKVSKDKQLFVPNITGKEGDSVYFTDVLLFSENNTIKTGMKLGKCVKAQIIRHIKGNKVIAFKMKRRKGFRKKKGHRTHYTQIKINEIASST